MIRCDVSYGPELDIAYYRHGMIANTADDMLEQMEWEFRVAASHTYDEWFKTKPLYGGETAKTIVESGEDYRAVILMYMAGNEL